MFYLPTLRVALVCALALIASCGGGGGSNSGSGGAGGGAGGGTGGGSGSGGNGNGGSGGGGNEGPAPSPPLAALIAPEQYSILLGSAVEFDAVQLAAFAEPITYDWDFGDGATATGSEVTHSYTEAGYYAVELTATDADGASFTAHAPMAVLDPVLPVLAIAGGMQRAPLPGDIDGDSDIDLKDLKALRDHYLEEQILPDSALQSCMVDFNLRVDGDDAQDLGRRMLGSGTDFAMSSSDAAPGGFVWLASPTLDDPAARVEVQFPMTDRFEVIRPAPGLAGFAVPFALVDIPGGIGMTVIEVWVDDVLTEVHDFEVLAPATGITPDAADLIASFDAVEPVLLRLETSIAEFAVLLGWTDSELHAVQGGIEFARQSFVAQRLEIETALLELDPAVQVDLEIAARANGFGYAVAELERLARQGPPPISGQAAPGDVILKRSSHVKWLIRALRAWQTSISAGVEACLVPSERERYFDGTTATVETQALFLVRDAIRGQQAGFDSMQVGRAMCGVSPSHVRMRFDDTAVLAGQVEVYVEGRLRGEEQLRICLQDLGGAHLTRILGNHLSIEMLRWRGAPDMAGWTQAQVQAGAIEAGYVQAVIDLGEVGLDEAGLNLLLESAIQKRLAAASEEVWFPCELNGALIEPPVEDGTLVFPNPRTGDPAVFTCNPLDVPGYVTFDYFEKNKNGVNWAATEEWACELLPVQFQISDPTIVKDDAFELRVNGIAIAATDRPSDPIDVAALLERGEHVITLIGRNSNPGLTPIRYLMSFTGAEVVSGPALEDDIAIGESVEWTIAVPTIAGS